MKRIIGRRLGLRRGQLETDTNLVNLCLQVDVGAAIVQPRQSLVLCARHKRKRWPLQHKEKEETHELCQRTNCATDFKHLLFFLSPRANGTKKFQNAHRTKYNIHACTWPNKRQVEDWLLRAP